MAKRRAAWTAAAAIGAAIALGPIPAARAGEPEPVPAGRLALSTERVVVFKDGYALFVKSATGTADAEGRVHTEKVPDAAVLGCVWATTAAPERKLLSMRSEWVETRWERAKEDPCVTPLELLRANAGKRVTLGLTREKEPDVEGVLEQVLEIPPEPPPPPGPEGRRPATGPAGEAATPREPRGGTLVVLTTAAGRLVLPIAEVRTVRGPDLATKASRVSDVVRREKRLSFDFGKAAAATPVSMRLLYFAEGIRWIPTYRLSGALDGAGELALQGEILNDAEDLAETDVHLVVGVPHFRFRDTASPLTLEQTMRGVLDRVAPQLRAQQMSSNRFSNGNDEGSEEGAAGGAAGARLAPELTATGEQDLFVYDVGKATLARGARETRPLWQSTVPLRHLYTLDVRGGLGSKPDASAESPERNAPDQPGPSPLRAGRNDVWHQLELSNGSTFPWTTGPALLLRDDLPLGQDLLTYTSPGSKALLPVTVAVDVRGTFVEEETERVPNALTWAGWSHALIRRRGRVTVSNHRKDPSPLRVTAEVVGKAESADEGGTLRIESSNDVNARSRVSWEATLAPGETKTFTFTMGFYVRQ